MIKNVVWSQSGIVRKQAQKVLEWNGYSFYGLTSDLDNGELPEYGTVYFEHNDYLFYLCTFNRLKQLIENNPTYTKEELSSFEQRILNQYNEAINSMKQEKPGICLSRGIMQYLQKENEAMPIVKEYMAKMNKREQEEKQRREKEEFEKKRIEEEKRYNELCLARDKFLQNEIISAEDFLELCSLNKIVLPIKTKGWAKKYLRSVQVESSGAASYTYCGKNKSEVTLDYIRQLYNVLKTT